VERNIPVEERKKAEKEEEIVVIEFLKGGSDVLLQV